MMDYNPRLDALRALCVFGVMCFHWQGILQFGWIGVQTFFVLSGFLMTGILTPAKEKYDARNFFLVFQWRRALRIFPAYFGYVFFLAGVFWLTRQPSSLPQVIPFLSTLTLNIARLLPWFNNDQAYTHLWSLGVEMQFYLLWPLLIYFTNRERLPILIYFLLATTPLLRFLTELQTSAVYSDPEAIGNAVYNSPLSHLDAFAAGAAVSLGIPGFRSGFGQKFAVLASITVLAGLGLTIIVPPARLTHSVSLVGVPDQSAQFSFFGLGIQFDRSHFGLSDRDVKDQRSPVLSERGCSTARSDFLRYVSLSSSCPKAAKATAIRKSRNRYGKHRILWAVYNRYDPAGPGLIRILRGSLFAIEESVSATGEVSRITPSG